MTSADWLRKEFVLWSSLFFYFLFLTNTLRAYPKALHCSKVFSKYVTEKLRSLAIIIQQIAKGTHTHTHRHNNNLNNKT